jgi:hypothetical protein
MRERLFLKQTQDEELDILTKFKENFVMSSDHLFAF